ncbi:MULTISPECIES: hypothetical protein [unclassified Arthrobacter]|uniref:hypothetical protein n=1 Tax=unclassified Arthrobacter TaxID=235627 RepID=UPI0024DFAAAA|nr:MULTISPECIES: hypothetical protein [unclassified Arthrobacter]MCC9146091.1 hypothetical protein [Arthrobacter sp. zg-Y919]MDK1277320.1 hypothetical protein [Arthrobacter sp. zg.Y919]WIB03822.1 hypothetical protein QNO10_03880 [Arthrobacter sp. zg-Y919]
MNFLYSLATAVTPAPEETLAPGVDPSDVTPGTLGFLFTLFMVIAIIFLIRDMTKRIRRVRYREQLVTEKLEREAAAAPDAAGPVPAKSTPSAPEDRDTTWDHLK